jgi:hypothetical protein
MPSEAPDRVIDAVRQAVETAPQVRRPIGAAFRRSFQMNRIAIATASALVVLVLVGGAFVLTRSNVSQIGGPSSSPGSSVAVSPSASGAAGAMPAALQGVWLGSGRQIPGTTAGAGTQLHIGPASMALTPSTAGNRNLMAVTASAEGSQFQVQTGSDPTDGCQPGKTGTYTYLLSASGQTLTIGGEDGCPQRAQLFGGTWWLSDCHTQDAAPCLGQLDPGDYGSQYFASVGAQGVAWAPRFGALTFTVPAGWASDADWPSLFSLAPAADYAAAPLHGTPAEDIAVYSNVVAESETTPCSGQANDSVAPGAGAYLAWLRTVPGLSVGSTSTVSIGGHQGLSVDITVPQAPTELCDGTDAVIEYLLSIGWGTSGASTGIQAHAIGAGNHDRLILLEMPSGSLTGIVITTNDSGRFDAFAQQAMPIVASFQFKDAFPAP